MAESKTDTLLKKAKQTALSVPPQVWTGVIVVGAGVALYQLAVKPILNRIDNNELDKDFDKGKDQVTGKNTEDGTVKATITDNEALSIANMQEQAMSELPFHTNEEKLFNSLKNLNGKDLQKVFNAFGLRWYDPITGATSGSLWPGAQKIDLFTWYSYDLNDEELQQMAAIWKKSGLSFFTESVNGLGMVNTLKVSGVVVDSETGQPMPNVNVYVQGNSGVGAATNSNGVFTFQAQISDQLVFSHLGYGKRVLPAIMFTGFGAITPLSVESSILDEAVVTPNTEKRNWWPVVAAVASGFLIAGVKPEEAKKAVKQKTA